MNNSNAGLLSSFSECDFEKLTGFMSILEIQNSRDSMEMKQMSSVCQDYAGECPITNVLTDMVDHLEGVEVGVDGEQAEFYEDDTGFCLTTPLTLQLRDWQIRFEKGKTVPVGMIYIGRDESLPEGEQLAVGIDYGLGNYNIDDLHLAGIERRVTRKHIADSIRGDCEYCAIANVISEIFNDRYEVHVDDQCVLIHSAGVQKAQLTHSERLSVWIDAYDNECDVGTFTLIIRDLDNKQEGNHYLLDIKELTDSQKDLQKRISKLSELSSDITLHSEKLTDTPEDIDTVEREYQDLFSETVDMFG